MDGVSRATINTLGGKTAENRGRRGDSPPNFNPDSPFEDGQLSDNWGKRQGWDKFYTSHQGKGPKNYKRSDKATFEEVCVVLAASRDVDATNIDVDAKDGVVTLRGEVRGRKMKRLSETLIENISGVLDVQNLLSFKRRDYEVER